MCNILSTALVYMLLAVTSRSSDPEDEDYCYFPTYAYFCFATVLYNLMYIVYLCKIVYFSKRQDLTARSLLTVPNATATTITAASVTVSATTTERTPILSTTPPSDAASGSSVNDAQRPISRSGSVLQQAQIARLVVERMRVTRTQTHTVNA